MTGLTARQLHLAYDKRETARMIDYLTLALTHGLIALALWRLLSRAELDSDAPAAPRRRPWKREQPDA
jgi:hypothetical protein